MEFFSMQLLKARALIYFNYIGLALFGVATVSFCVAEPVQRDANPEVKHLLEQVVEGDKNERIAAWKNLTVIPQEPLIANLSNLLRNEPKFQEAKWREPLYRLLKDQQAQESDLGRKLMIAGLSDPYVGIQRMSLDGLMRLPQGDYPNVRAAIDDLWKEVDMEQIATASEPPRDEYSALRGPILRAVSMQGNLAKPYLETIHGILRNAKLDEGIPWYRSKKGIRVVAAGAIVYIVGIENALPYFQDLDHRGEHHVLRVLISMGTETKGTFNTDAEHRRQIRQIVLQGLTSPNKDVRRAASEALFPVFGDDVVIIHSPDDYEWNPMFIGSLKQMGANNPDEELRQQATHALKQLDLDKVVEKILGKRQQEQQTKPQGNE